MAPAWPIKKTPRFNTVVQTPASRRGEVRIPLQLFPVYDFELDFSLLVGDYQTQASAFAEFLAFFNAAQGQAGDWLYNDPYDNGATVLVITNGNFEQSSSLPPPGWTAFGSPSLSYDTTTQYQGVRSLIVTGNNAGVQSSSLPVQPGQTISASAVAKLTAVGGSGSNAQLIIEFFDINGALLSFAEEATSNGDWTPVTVDATAPASAASFAVLLKVFGNGSNATGEYDVVTAQIMTLGPQLIGYGDGTTTQFQVGRALNGAAPFEMMQNVFPTALFINGVQVPAGPQPSGNQWYCGLENLLNYSQDLSQSAYWIPQGCTIASPSITAPDGSSTANALTSSSTDGFVTQIFPVSQGVYTFSVWLKVPSGTLNTYIHLRAVPLGIIGDFVIQPITVTTSWRRFSVTGTFPGFFSQALAFLFGNSTVPSGQVVHIWGAQLERWSSATSYVATTNNAPQFPRGLAKFTVAPGGGLPVTADFSYYYRCRFLDDALPDLQEFLYQYWELESLRFRSLLL